MISASKNASPRLQPHRTIVDVKYGSDGDDESSLDELIENNPGPSTATSITDLVAARRSSEADKIRFTNGLNLGISRRKSAANTPRFLPPISVIKIDNLTEQPSSNFVELQISDDQLILFMKSTSDKVRLYVILIVLPIEAIYIDEIVDIFVGSHWDLSKQKNDSQIQKIINSSMTMGTCVMNDCFFTVSYGLDFVNPHTLIFLAKTPDEAKLWCQELRKFTVKNHCKIQNSFYYWKRLFSKLHCIINEELFTIERFSGRNIGDEEFKTYLNQKHRDPRLNEILYPFATNKTARQILSKAGIDTKSPIDNYGYLRFLLSEQNLPVRKEAYMLNDDSMNKPLSHYFINSSHNTYLKGKQDVIEAIAETAFVTSDYPVILSFENHCSQKQQIKMAQYCKDILGDLLLKEALTDYPIKAGVHLPSPNVLKRRILIKNKIEKKTDAREANEKTFTRTMSKQTSVDSGSIEEDALERAVTRIYIGDNDDDFMITSSSPKIDKQLSFDNPTPISLQNGRLSKADDITKELELVTELSDLVTYMRAMGKFTSFVDCDARQIHSEMYSMNETKAIDLLKQHSEQFVNHNKKQITRVYPRGSRVDSSNYMPLPSCMRKAQSKFDPFELDRVENVVPNSMTITVISGQMFIYLCEKRVSVYVEIDLYGLPGDSHKKMFKTRTVPSDGLNTVFIDGISNCMFNLEKIILPAMAYVRFGVFEEGGRLIGQRILPVSYIQPGYKHIVLYNAFNKPLGPVTLFVHIDVQDYVSDAHRDLVNALQNPIEAMSRVREIENALEDPKAALSKEEQNQRLLEVLESAGKGMPQGSIDLPLSIDSGEEAIPGTPTTTTTSGLGSSIAAAAGIVSAAVVHKDSMSGSGFDFITDSPSHIVSRAQTPPVDKKNAAERKYTVLSEYVANKQPFYLEKMSVALPSPSELEETQKIQKLIRAFNKKYPGFLEAVNTFDHKKVNEFTQHYGEKQSAAALHKFIKEKNELMHSAVEQQRKQLQKSIEIAFQSETKQLQKINAKSRLEELSGINKRSSPIEYKRLSDKYVRRGVEESRKLLVIKTKKADELNEHTHVLKLELNNKFDEVSSL
uniref:1-phosphatidylinositol 4,5-bisphosphate phosphodiesterase n=1 Tax=Panagrolaimus sp. ES5 TaxID=591445 RepID=A0AC34FLG7_9BILA